MFSNNNQHMFNALRNYIRKPTTDGMFTYDSNKFDIHHEIGVENYVGLISEQIDAKLELNARSGLVFDDLTVTLRSLRSNIPTLLYKGRKVEIYNRKEDIGNVKYVAVCFEFEIAGDSALLYCNPGKATTLIDVGYIKNKSLYVNCSFRYNIDTVDQEIEKERIRYEDMFSFYKDGMITEIERVGKIYLSKLEQKYKIILEDIEISKKLNGK